MDGESEIGPPTGDDRRPPVEADEAEQLEQTRGPVVAHVVVRSVHRGGDVGELEHGATVLDVGCGACRVAHMVRTAGKGHAIGIDLSLETLRAAAAHNPDPVANGDNMRLPIRGDVADLVITVPSDDTPRIQESHIAIGHILCEIVEAALFGSRPA